MVKLLFVCHGNICRSPMAEFVCKALAKEAGLDGQLQIASAATSDEALGCDIHPQTQKKLRQAGIYTASHQAVQLCKGDYARYDAIIGMDGQNRRNMLRLFGSDPVEKLHLLLDYTPRGGDIADPWYTGNFDATYRDILKGCKGLLQTLQEQGRIL